MPLDRAIRTLVIVLLTLGLGLMSAKFFYFYISLFFYVCFISTLITFIFAFFSFKFGGKFLPTTIKYSNEVTYLYSSLVSLIVFCFLSTVPLNLDRSFSVWMLNQTASSAEAYSTQDLENLASDFFAPSGLEIKRRINEQISIGNMERRDEKILLTDKGEFTWKLFRVISDFFGLNKKYTG